MNTIDELIAHLDAGGQITHGPQAIYRVSEGEYFICCDDQGCCDDFLTLEDVRETLKLNGWRKIERQST